ncbi:unnamed protein product [Lathyrus oleraceus]
MGQRGMLGLKDWCWDYDSTSSILVVGCDLRKEVRISQLGVLCSNTNGICGFEAQHEAKPEWSEILQQFSFSFRRVLVFLSVFHLCLSPKLAPPSRHRQS